MNSDQFNQKYSAYLEEGHYGLDIDIPAIISYLDKIFQELTQIPSFQYSQIKLKFSEGRFYNNLDVILGFNLSRMINNEIERKITLLSQAHYEYIKYQQ
jgi:hypothetical protein